MYDDQSAYYFTEAQRKYLFNLLCDRRSEIVKKQRCYKQNKRIIQCDIEMAQIRFIIHELTKKFGELRD